MRFLVPCGALLAAAHLAACYYPHAGCKSNTDCQPGYTCTQSSCNLSSDGGVTSAGTVGGSANGAPFTSVATALVIGAPDDPTTTVIYLFSQSVACADLGSPGWDTRISSGTHVLEMKLFGTAPGTFTVTRGATPAAGDASVNVTLAGQEFRTTGGTVQLDEILAGTSAGGSFSAIATDTGSLTGTFSATFCADGHEP